MPQPASQSCHPLNRPLRICSRCEVPMCFLGVLPAGKSETWLYYCDCGEQVREVAALPHGRIN
jgi:hypothetical protein